MPEPFDFVKELEKMVQPKTEVEKSLDEIERLRQKMKEKYEHHRRPEKEE